MLLDANLLVYAVDADSAGYEAAADWLESQLSSPARVGLPWQSIGASVRITTHPRVFERPLASAEAWGHVEAWLAAPHVWIPAAGAATAVILGRLLQAPGITGKPRTRCAARGAGDRARGGGCQCRPDFARFPECRWINPLR
ncbi:MAG: uncharacterized protein QG597_1968 [Actinomycetota bacterium]|nr:uncharacterized protein [Actinomycetota bacterium]